MDFASLSATNITHLFTEYEIDGGKNIIDEIEYMPQRLYKLKSIFNSYTESLITEILLLMQIVEDKDLLSECENCQEICNIVRSLDQTEMCKVRLSPKYINDTYSVLNHLRNSFTHLNYLNNQNEKLYIYDYVSKRNRTPDFKFTITVDQLGQIKDEVLKIVCKNELAQANEDDLSHERS